MKINLLEDDATDIRVEIIPLIDVIFCILTFFILAALNLTRQQAINLDLPKASTGVAQSRELLVVSLDGGGQTFVNKQPVLREQLSPVMQAYLKTKPDGLIVLNAAPMVSYNEVIQVLDLLRSVGGDRVALATQPVDKPVLANPTSSPGSLPGALPGAQPSSLPSGTDNIPPAPPDPSTLP